MLVEAHLTNIIFSLSSLFAQFQGLVDLVEPPFVDIMAILVAI